MNWHQPLPWSRAAQLSTDCVEADVRDELACHLDLAIEEGLARGLSEEQARQEALARFGDFERTVRGCTRQKLGNSIMWLKLSWISVAVLLVALVLATHDSYRQRALLERSHAEIAARSAMESHALMLGAPDRLEPRELVARLGDVIVLVTNSHGHLNRSETVTIEGTILLAEVGHVSVVGLTRPEIEEVLRAALAPMYQDDLNLFVRVNRVEDPVLD